MRLNSILTLGLIGFLAACSGSEAERQENLERQRANIDERFQNTTGLFDLIGGGGDPDRQINVNRHLWAASLDVLSFLPVETADPFSGVIVTGWGRVPGTGVPYRATVLVQDPALDARSLRVAVFRQSGSRAVPVSDAVSEQIEDAILTRAREMRIANARR